MVLLVASFLLVIADVVSRLPRPTPTAFTGSHQSVLHNPISSALLAQYGVVLAVLVVIAGGLAWLGAGRMLRPLRQITDTARRITSEDLHERLTLGGPADELTELGDTFDAMLARLESAFPAARLGRPGAPRRTGPHPPQQRRQVPLPARLDRRGPPHRRGPRRARGLQQRAADRRRGPGRAARTVPARQPAADRQQLGPGPVDRASRRRRPRR